MGHWHFRRNIKQNFKSFFIGITKWFFCTPNAINGWFQFVKWFWTWNPIFCFRLYICCIVMHHEDLINKMPKQQNNKIKNWKSDFRFGLYFIYLLHMCYIVMDHYDFNDKNVKMGQLKKINTKSDFRCGLHFITYCTYIM